MEIAAIGRLDEDGRMVVSRRFAEPECTDCPEIIAWEIPGPGGAGSRPLEIVAISGAASRPERLFFGQDFPAGVVGPAVLFQFVGSQFSDIVVREPPAPPGAAYPLTATAEEMEGMGVGVTGALALSNANQTATYAMAGALAETEQYGATTPPGSPQLIDMGSAKKFLEWKLDPESHVSGPGTVIMAVALAKQGFASGIQVYASKDVDGTLHIVAMTFAGGEMVASAAVSGLTWAPHYILVEVDATGSGSIIVKVDDEALTLAPSSFAKGSYIVFESVIEYSGSSAEDAGKTFAITLNTSRSNVHSTVDGGYVDIDGNP